MPSKKIREENKELEDKIISLLKSGSMYQPDIARALNLKHKKDHKIIRKVIDKLEKSRFIVRGKRNILQTISSKELISGRISITAQGFGFVTPVEPDIEKTTEQDIFIPAKHINSAFDGDLVQVRIIEKNANSLEKGPVGIVHTITKRKRTGVVGELIISKNGFALRPLNRKVPDDIPVIGDIKDAKKGDWVNADINYGTNRQSRDAVCEIINKIGKVGDIENDMQAIMQEYSLMPRYTEQEDLEASKSQPYEIKRDDLTNLFCVTIDPHDAKDFDDSVSYAETDNPNECLIGIHIADVAAWVQPGNWLDDEASQRGFTAYIPGNTLPMLPKSLTKLMSLTVDKTNNAHSVLLTVSKKTGKIINYKRKRSLIKIAHRLTFTEVEDYIKRGKIQDSWSSELIKSLDNLIRMYKLMRSNRDEEEKFLNLTTTEIRVLRDDKTGEILGIEKKKQGEADQLIEEYMLAANSAVAAELVNSQAAGIFRIHAEPDSEKLQEFSEFAKYTFNLNTGNLSAGRVACRNFLEKLQGKSYEEIVTSAFLRALTRAVYSNKPSIHFGLGKGLYSHFTSPIRRYTDLAIHQQLWNKDVGKKLKNESEMSQIADRCTEQEKTTDDAWFAANDRLKLHYLNKVMKDGKDETYEAVIRHITSTTILADIIDIGVTACIPLAYMKGHFKKTHGSLNADRGSQHFKPGDFIYAKLDRIDFIKGDAIFRPIQF